MEFICKCCNEKAHGETFDDIIATGKLCNECFKLDEDGRERVRRAVYAKTHKFEKPDLSRKKPPKRKSKGSNKKKRRFTFICSYCGKDSKTDFKPYSCRHDGCLSRTFVRKEVR